MDLIIKFGSRVSQVSKGTCKRCKGCSKGHKACTLHGLENNMIPESNYDLRNCKYAYKKVCEKKKAKIKKKYSDISKSDKAKELRERWKNRA